MLWLADALAGRWGNPVFGKNRMYEVLGLFVLLIVGMVLLGEAAPAVSHAMHYNSLTLKLFGYEVMCTSKNHILFQRACLGRG